MARIRSISPDQWTDDDFCALSIYARMLALALRNMADDNGIVPLKPVAIKAGCLPADPVDIAALLDELEAANVFLVYQQGPSKFLLIRNFQTFQRPDRPNFKHPTPEGDLPHGYTIRKAVPGKNSTTTHRHVTEDSLTTPRHVAPVLGKGIGEVLDHPVRVSTQTQSPQPRPTGQSQKSPQAKPTATALRSLSNAAACPSNPSIKSIPSMGSTAVPAASSAAPSPPPCLRASVVNPPGGSPFAAALATLTAPATPEALAERCTAIDPRGRTMAPWYTHVLQRLDALEALPDVLELLDHAEAHANPEHCATKGLTPLHRPGPWLVRQLTTLLTANGIRHWPDLPELHPNPRKATA